MGKLTFLGAAITGIFSVVVPPVYNYIVTRPLYIDERLHEAEAFLDIGHYAEAKQRFEQVLKDDPRNTDAAWGLKKAEAGNADNPALFETLVRELYREEPNDAHVNLFMGWFHAALHDREQAIPYLTEALKRKLDYPEAHFALGLLHAQLGEQKTAEFHYRKAVDLRAAIPKYRNNLADLLAKQNRIDEAIAEYGKISNFPLSALELAKLYWVKEDWAEAESLQREALELLKDPEFMQGPDQPAPWYFETGNQGIQLIKPADKIAYAQLCLRLTELLPGEPATSIPDFKLSRDLRDIMIADLKFLAQRNPRLEQRIRTVISSARTAG